MKTRKTSSKLFAILSLTRLLTSSIHVSTVCQYGLQNAVRALSTLICINNPHQPQLGPSTPLPWVQELHLRSGLEAGPSFSFVMVMPGCSYCHFGDWLSGLQLYFTCCCFFLKKSVWDHHGCYLQPSYPLCLGAKYRTGSWGRVQFLGCWPCYLTWLSLFQSSVFFLLLEWQVVGATNCYRR